MNRTRWNLISGAFVLGLFSGCFGEGSSQGLSQGQWALLIVGWIIFVSIIAIALPRFLVPESPLAVLADYRPCCHFFGWLSSISGTSGQSR